MLRPFIIDLDSTKKYLTPGETILIHDPSNKPVKIEWEEDHVEVGTKFDDGKLRYDLLDHVFEKAMARVVTDGAAVHGDNNWQQLKDAKARYYAALRRHLDAWLDGEVIDPKHGTPHMAHVAVNAMFLDWFDRSATSAPSPDTPATGDLNHLP